MTQRSERNRRISSAPLPRTNGKVRAPFARTAPSKLDSPRIETRCSRKVSTVATLASASNNFTAAGGTKETGPVISLEAGAINTSATSVCSIQVPTVWRNEKIMTVTPIVMATAEANAATVTEFRPSDRARCADARGNVRKSLPERPKTSLIACAKKRIAAGAKNENPASVQNAETNPTMGGPIARAHHALKAAKIKSAIAAKFHGAEELRSGRLMSGRNVAAISNAAARRAGIQAAAPPEKIPTAVAAR